MIKMDRMVCPGKSDKVFEHPIILRGLLLEETVLDKKRFILNDFSRFTKNQLEESDHFEKKKVATVNTISRRDLLKLLPSVPLVKMTWPHVAQAARMLRRRQQHPISWSWYLTLCRPVMCRCKATNGKQRPNLPALRKKRPFFTITRRQVTSRHLRRLHDDWYLSMEASRHSFTWPDEARYRGPKYIQFASGPIL